MTTNKPTKTLAPFRWLPIAVAITAVATVLPAIAADPGKKQKETEMKTASIPPQHGNLFLLEDLADAIKTRKLAESDLKALHAVADWTKTFVAKPHKDLGREGPVCPFVPGGLENKTFWLAPEHIADRTVPDVVQLMNGYKKLLLDAQPKDGDGADNKVIVVVFTDLSADRAKSPFDDVLKQLAVPSYEEDGILFGPFYEGNKGTAIYNLGFQPFQSPVPFLFVRHGVLLGQRRLARSLGASLWRVRCPGSC
jgi:hypothetical protein